MDSNDRQAIETLFEKLRVVERQGPDRDPEAEAFIQTRMERQPSAAYYMAQTIVVQEQALEAAQARIEQLETERAQAKVGSGFFGSLFGGSRPPVSRGMQTGRQPGPWDRSVAAPLGGRTAYRGSGGGFLSGAAQTAMGVAGGVLLGNAIAGMLDGDETEVAETEPNLEDAAAADDVGGFDDFEV